MLAGKEAVGGFGDIKNIAQMLGGPEAVDEMENLGPVRDVDINNLDYHFISNCTDIHEVKALLAYLRTGKEGSYPDLELHMLRRLSQLDPVNYPLPLSDREKYDLKQQVGQDLNDWIKETSAASSATPALTSQQRHDSKSENMVRPLAGSTIASNQTSKTPEAVPAVTTTSITTSSLRLKSNDYRSWDKFNVESELEKIDLNQDSGILTQKTIVVKNVEKSAAIPASLTPQQTKSFAENEKIKGNDCIRAHEYDQALYHYNTSINLSPNVAVLNNRALCFLKLEKWDRAIGDCTSALSLDPGNFKSLLRRAKAYFSQGRYQDATIDIDLAMEQNPESKEAAEMRRTIIEKWSDSDGTINNPPAQKLEKKKMKIVEIEEEEEYEVQEARNLTIGEILALEKDKHMPAQDVNITEVEDDSSDEDN